MTRCILTLRHLSRSSPSTYIFTQLRSLRRHGPTLSSWNFSGLFARVVPFSTARAVRVEQPRSFPTKGYELIDHIHLVEEEKIAGSKPEFFYPVHIGEVFEDQFQIVAKLGYGACSTIWLARDLKHHEYVALKVYIHNSMYQRELPFYEHLRDVLRDSRHPGTNNVRKLLGLFQVVGPHGTHPVLVHQVAQMSLYDMDKLFMKGNGFNEDVVKTVIMELLKAVDFLHSEVQAVHTDIHPGNLLLGSDDASVFKKVEDAEHSNPVARKELPDRTVYCSRLMKPDDGELLLSDFGEARLGCGPYTGDAMPVVYRAPEIILQMQWSYPVDIWSVGLTAWNLLEGRSLFRARKEDGSISDGAHLSELIAALGSPPVDLLGRNQTRALEYWDEQGKWNEFVPIPTEKTLDAAETKLEDKTKFLAFVRRALTWDPNKRPKARDLLKDPWLSSSA